MVDLFTTRRNHKLSVYVKKMPSSTRGIILIHSFFPIQSDLLDRQPSDTIINNIIDPGSLSGLIMILVVAKPLRLPAHWTLLVENGQPLNGRLIISTFVSTLLVPSTFCG